MYEQGAERRPFEAMGRDASSRVGRWRGRIIAGTLPVPWCRIYALASSDGAYYLASWRPAPPPAPAPASRFAVRASAPTAPRTFERYPPDLPPYDLRYTY